MLEREKKKSMSYGVFSSFNLTFLLVCVRCTSADTMVHGLSVEIRGQVFGNWFSPSTLF